MNKSVLIQTILDNHPLVEYLQTKGHEPARTAPTRLVYHCPFHGTDKTPSFYVFLGKEHQYFHCFGCKCHGDIINAVSMVEQCSIKDAIGRLAFGLKISQEELFDKLAQEITSRERKMDNSMEEMSIRMSCAFHSYIHCTEYDPEEVKFMESVFEKVDKIILAMDYDVLASLYEKLMDEGIPARLRAFEARKEKEAIQNYVTKAYAT